MFLSIGVCPPHPPTQGTIWWLFINSSPSPALLPAIPVSPSSFQLLSNTPDGLSATHHVHFHAECLPLCRMFFTTPSDIDCVVIPQHSFSLTSGIQFLSTDYVTTADMSPTLFLSSCSLKV